MLSIGAVLKNARSIMINDVVYYDLYDLGFTFGYKRWDGKTYNDNGEKVELPYKSKINNLAKEAEIDLLYYNDIHPMVPEYQIECLILESNTKACRELKKEILKACAKDFNIDLGKLMNTYFKKGDR
jgi:hypothetical protein